MTKDYCEVEKRRDPKIKRVSQNFIKLNKRDYPIKEFNLKSIEILTVREIQDVNLHNFHINTSITLHVRTNGVS